MKLASHELGLIALMTVGTIMVGSISTALALLSLGTGAATVIGHGVFQRAADAPFFRNGGGSRLVRRLATSMGSTWALMMLAAAVMSSAAAGMILLVAAGLVALVVWLRSRQHDDTYLADDGTELARAISLATNAELAELWRRSAIALWSPQPTAAMMRYVEIRRVILEEAERRAPDRVSAWLTENPRTDSLRGYLR